MGISDTVSKIQFKPSYYYEVVQFGVTKSADLAAISAAIKSNLLAIFEVKVQPNGSFQTPDYYAIFEHTSPDSSFGKVIADHKVVSFAHTTVLSVGEQIEISLRYDKYYEFFTAWVNDGKQEYMQKFFDTSQPIKERYGRPAPLFLVQFQPATETDDEVYFTPSLGGLVEWDDYSDVEVLLNNEEFKEKAAPLFGEAISRIEMIIGKVIIL